MAIADSGDKSTERIEYLNEFKQLRQRHEFKGEQWFGHRKRLVERYGWAVPNEEVLDYITSCFDRITEIGSGSGYWAKLLSERGTTVHAFDPDTDKEWYDVHEERASDVRNYIEGNPVLLVWPPANDSMAERVLSYDPSHVLYVGESSGGCTANDAFFKRLNKEYGPVEKVNIPSYAGVDDNFHHYVQKRGIEEL
jgi:SAM-dependent methyltransferase